VDATLAADLRGPESLRGKLGAGLRGELAENCIQQRREAAPRGSSTVAARDRGDVRQANP